LTGYEITEHTADVGVVATGSTLPEALSALAQGMFSVIADLDTVDARETIQVSVESGDTEALAVDWLNELLFRHESEFFLPKQFTVSVNRAGTGLTARCGGEFTDPQRHRMLTYVKAATYHNLKVEQTDGWRIQMVLDV